MYRIILLVAFWSIGLPLNAQYQQQILFPGQQDNILLQSLANAFKPGAVLSYSEARDTMFAIIYQQNDSLRCVYTEHRLFLDPTLDPTQAVFMNGADDGINTEHTWPQAFGAGVGAPRSDMNHLFPTRIAVNGARGNLPFADINDQQTENWFYLNQNVQSIPSQHIDRYSELSVDRFEPREDHKGNVARAMFYFYTMYRAQADAGNPSYFESQRIDLCNWHLQDPVDSLEWHRAQLIAHYQDDRANPFVLDCTLPQRTYCADLAEECDFVIGTRQPRQSFAKLLPNVPNPFSGQTTIRYELPKASRLQLVVFNALGQLQEVLVDQWQPAGKYSVAWKPTTGSGLFFCQLRLWQGTNYTQLQQSLLVNSSP